MKSLRLNIRALSFDGKTPISSNCRITYNPKTDSHDLIAQSSSSLGKFGLLRMSDLVAQKVIAATDHAYACWIGHSGQAGVTSFVVRSFRRAEGRRIGTSAAQDSDPSTGTGPVGPFELRPTDELVLTSNATGEQLVALALLTGTAAEVATLFNRG